MKPTQLRFWPDPQPVVDRLGTASFRQLPEVPGVYFMYGAGAHIPLPVRLLVRALFPRQPIWRFYILSRFLAKYTGLLHGFALLSYLARAARRRRAPAAAFSP